MIHSGLCAPYKADEPCENYFGNVCSGFGAERICWHCGWDMMDHPDQQYEIRLGSHT